METRVQSIPLNKLVPSERNVRRTGREIGIEALAASITAHGLLQNLTVRPATAGRLNGAYEVIAGGRRLAALKLLAKTKALTKDHPVNCRIVEVGSAEEVSLAENVVRENLHPADQFEAFRHLHDNEGQGCEDIAARFGVTATVVRQRLRLSAVSPMLIQLYRAGEMTLEQLMAFTVTNDQERQDAAWEGLSWNKEASTIRRALAEGRVRGNDRRAIFVGAETYEAAGGLIERDLFADDYGGYFNDPSLLDRLVLDKLAGVAEAVREAGWRWIAVSVDLPNAHGLRRLYPQAQPLSATDEARLDNLNQEYEGLAAEHDTEDELSETVADRLDTLSTEIDTLEQGRFAYDPADIARSGAFVVLAHDGTVKVEAGFVRPEDEPKQEAASPAEGNDRETEPDEHVGAISANAALLAISDRLLADLTAHRTAALQDRLAGDPGVALLAVIHTLALQTFYYGYDLGSCLDLKLTRASLATHAPTISESRAGQNSEARHAAWAARMPEQSTELWTFVGRLDLCDRLALLAHCASPALNAVRAWERRPHALDHADQLALALDLDMAAYWKPTAAGYFCQVTKAHIVEAVREAVSDEAANRLEGLKKADMAEAAEALVTDLSWVPAVLRTPATEADVPVTVAT